jgi:XTP/dITP diphosphohydrolase
LSRRIVLASNNGGKLAELQALLSDMDIEFVPQGEHDVPEAEETGLTFVENAIIKARNASRFTGLPAIADDSGIEVDHLGGEPGVRSARYAGEDATDEDNLQKLLHKLDGVAATRRGFRCEIVWLRHEHDPSPVICSGTWAGHVATDPRGDNGFGYDPIFLFAGGEQTTAELDPASKNRLSHRGQALAKLVKMMRDELV